MSQPHVIAEPEVKAKRSLLLQKSCHLIKRVIAKNNVCNILFEREKETNFFMILLFLFCDINIKVNTEKDWHSDIY